MNRFRSFLTIMVVAQAAWLPASEIDYVEDFVFAPDRAVILQQLIPGTEDYYYYHCLHYQNTEQFEKVDQFLEAWIKRYNYTPRVNEIRNRQALLTYARSPEQSLAYLRQTLNLQYNHQRQAPGQKPDLPTQLDAQSISRTRLLGQALQRYRNLQGLEDRALNWAVNVNLSPDQRRDLLQRLTRPDFANLVSLITDDLDYRNSGGFGSLDIHRLLLLDQLESLLERKPQLLNDANLVNIYLTKLQPAADDDWQLDPQDRRAYLDRLWKFVSRLSPAHNSLKASVLHYQLALGESQGNYDKQLFLAYLKLPRTMPYVNPKYLEQGTNRQFQVDLSANYSPQTLLAPIGNDEPLIRSYLQHFFIEETTYQPYEEYLRTEYLKVVFAETKILNGLGDPEQWASLIPAATFQQLKQRVDLDFAPTNRKQFGGDEPVRLDLYVKNVETLIVKVFEINEDSYYREFGQQVDSDVNLDGLVANEEVTHRYEEGPFRRVKRHFEFPELRDRGVYVIDFIGNGKSSRAVIRKGKLGYLVRTSTAGQVFTVLDEQQNPVNDATLWMDGHLYEPDQDGELVVPFSTEPTLQRIVLSHRGFSWLDSFQHEAEQYELQAGVHVDREMLLARRTAVALIRPLLRLNGTPVSLNRLNNVRLVVTSTDLDDVSTTKEISDFKLYEDREATFEFPVPPRMASLSLTLVAEVKLLSRTDKVDLSTAQTFSINAIDETEKVQDLHLVVSDAGYQIQILGKNGEAKSDQAVQLTIKHRDFRDSVTVALRTDGSGLIHLGALADIDSVTASDQTGLSRTWTLQQDRHDHYRSLFGQVGQALQIPVMIDGDQLSRDHVSLLEVRSGTFVADRFENLALKDGVLEVQGLPAGDYDLLLKNQATPIRIQLTEGPVVRNYVLGDLRRLEIRGSQPLQIARLDGNQEQLEIQLENSSKFARVHVFATHFENAFDAFSLLAMPDSEPYQMQVPRVQSIYYAGRDIGDEYRYIIERKYSAKFPGNMLTPPAVLLNPWPLRSTDTGAQQPQEGNMFGGAGGASSGSSTRGEAAARSATQPSDFSNLDFLAEPTAVLFNLQPGDDGLITIARSELGPHQHFVVVAVDPNDTVYRKWSVPTQAVPLVDLRVQNPLDPERHFTQQQQISLVAPGQPFSVDDVATARVEVYHDLAGVYRLYSTLSGDPTLAEFSFILDWPTLSLEEKQKKYSQYACHELHFFLYQKDPEFFREIVAPYLANKKDKMFLDQWLLDQDLIEYLQPWRFEQLNIVERILLSRRIADQQQPTRQHVRDLLALVPPDVDHWNMLFQTAIQGRALDLGVVASFHRPDGGAMSSRYRRGGEVLSRSLQENLAATDREVASPPLAAAAPGRAGFDVPQAGAVAENGARMREGREQADAKLKAEVAGKLDEFRKKSAGDFYFQDKQAELSDQLLVLYQKLDKTQEWVENNYYRLPIEQHNAERVPVNAFWQDYVAHEAGQPFLSQNLAAASRNFTEIMMALSVLDLPFKADEVETTYDQTIMTMKTDGPMIVFHEEIKVAEPSQEATPILVSQNYFRQDDRYKTVDNERQDKYVSDEFLIYTVYGCQIVVTNPTSSRQKLDLLVQVPEGAMAVNGGKATRSVHVDLQPFNTQTIEYFFYFPEPGEFWHFPVHIAKNEQLVAFAEAKLLKVVTEPSQIDRESWQFVSQNGEPEDVIRFLEAANLQQIDLSKIAFRMKDKRFFVQVTELLARRHAYDHVLWSYGVLHDVPVAVQQFLAHDPFAQQCGSFLESPLLRIDPVLRRTYQHIEFKPLVNARAHQLGRRREIVNERQHEQYHQLLKILSYQRQLDDQSLMDVTYHLLLQDRVEDALRFFAQVNAQNLETRLQYDYLAAYLDFYQDNPSQARQIAEQYVDYPVPHWRDVFREVATQLDEIAGKGPSVIDPDDRQQQQTRLAATEPSFDFQVEARQVRLNYQNLSEVQVNYYLMDVELLFSRNPFVQQYSSQFASIEPNLSKTVPLDSEQHTASFELPAELHNSNVLVEVVGGGQRKSQVYYSNSLSLQVIENYGQLRLTEQASGASIAKAYVKVYALMQDGKVQFYKDGYTDLRGRFDFTSLNTNELDFVQRFALLVISDDFGAVVREANPPKR